MDKKIIQQKVADILHRSFVIEPLGITSYELAGKILDEIRFAELPQSPEEIQAHAVANGPDDFDLVEDERPQSESEAYRIAH